MLPQKFATTLLSVKKREKSIIACKTAHKLNEMSYKKSQFFAYYFVEWLNRELSHSIYIPLTISYIHLPSSAFTNSAIIVSAFASSDF